MTFMLVHYVKLVRSGGSMISQGWQLPRAEPAYFCKIFAENCMKMKEFGPRGGAHIPSAAPWIRHWFVLDI